MVEVSQFDSSCELVNDCDTAAGKFVHAWQQFGGCGESDAIADQQFGMQLAGCNHPEHAGVFEGLHAVAAKNFQFTGNHQTHGNRRIGFRSGHQADLDMAAAFSQAAYGIPAGSFAAERIC